MELEKQRAYFNTLNAILADQVFVLSADQTRHTAKKRLLSRRLLAKHAELIEKNCELIREELQAVELGAFDDEIQAYAELASCIVEKKLAGYLDLLKMLEFIKTTGVLHSPIDSLGNESDL